MMSAKSSSDSHIHSVVFSGTNVGGMSWTEIRGARACGDGRGVCVCVCVWQGRWGVEVVDS